MKKLIVLLMVGCMASSAMAAWVDDFESYPSSWGTIPSPWETRDDSGTSLWAHPSATYGMGTSAEGESAWGLSQQYRLAPGPVTQVYGKVNNRSGSTYSQSYIGVANAKGVTLSDYVRFGLHSRTGSNDASFILLSEDYEAGSYVQDNRTYWSSVSEDTWYDVKLDISGNQATGSFKAVTDSSWTLVGTVTLYDDYADTYVSIGAGRGGMVDDIGYVPEPATMALLSLGGLLLSRKKRA